MLAPEEHAGRNPRPRTRTMTRTPPLPRAVKLAFAGALLVTLAAVPLRAQGVTTSAVSGLVVDQQKLPVPGATIVAVHEPSGSTYDAVTNQDGRFGVLGMRVGGPYSVTASLTGFQDQSARDVFLSLGITTDLKLVLAPATVAETIDVKPTSDPVFSSSRTGASTALSRLDLATMPTVTQRLYDVTRLTPQARGASFAGQDPRANNITVDGAYFNNSFGLANTPGDRTGVAPVSLEAIDQVQVNIAPFDVRQGNFVGAGVNAVTRSGTNQFGGSFYYRFRNSDFVGTNARGLPYDPGSFEFRNIGGWASGPIVKNKLFAFGIYEDEQDTRPMTTFRANRGDEQVVGSTTRVLASDLERLSDVLESRFGYDTGPFDGIDRLTPARRFLLRGDYNISAVSKLSVRYNHLDSSADQPLSPSSLLGFGRNSGGAANTSFLGYGNSNYAALENIRSTLGEWNSVIGTALTNSLIVGYTTSDESRGHKGAMFPFVDVLDGAGVAYTSFGFEPFTPDNELRYSTLQLQDNVTKFGNRHSLTFGGSVQRYRSENVFFPGKQSVYVYNTLADFYANLAGAPVTLRRFQVRYSNIPGQEKPVQPLRVWYAGAYAQDEWRPRANLSVTAGVRMDVPVFGDTAYRNANVDALTFRDENGSAVQYDTAKLPDVNVLWSPRVGVNWDVNGDARTQVRGGTGIFTGPPPYVWISNQVGNTGVLTGFIQADNTRAYPFTPDIDAYKPATVTGAPATSVDLAVVDPEFAFPQVWRSNVALDRRLPWWNMTGTVELIYTRDIHGASYINANLPAAQAAFAGPDARPRWVGPSCNAPTVGPCQNRINNAAGNQITSAMVLQNQSVGRSWSVAASISKPLSNGFSFRGAYSYGDAQNTVDAGTAAAASFTGNPQPGDPNNAPLARSAYSPGHRVYVQGTYTRRYFGLGATTVSVFWEGRPVGPLTFSYVFSGDMNGDSATGNDLIYIPRGVSEMNFQPFTSGGVTFTAEQQAAAFDAYIAQDKYLSRHRGEYAERNGSYLPMVFRADLGVAQDLFTTLKGTRQGLQIRLDIQNFTNMLNHDWGVGQRVVRNQILTNPGVDAQGRPTYRMAVVNNQLLSRTFESTTNAADVYSFMISLRYSFN